MSDDLYEMEVDLANLNRAIRSGILSITVGGQTTMFQSIAQMQRVASDLERQIAECKGIASKKPRISSVRMDRGV